MMMHDDDDDAAQTFDDTITRGRLAARAALNTSRVCTSESGGRRSSGPYAASSSPAVRIAVHDTIAQIHMKCIHRGCTLAGD